jgi:hypothetical protein
MVVKQNGGFPVEGGSTLRQQVTWAEDVAGEPGKEQAWGNVTGRGASLSNLPCGTDG